MRVVWAQGKETISAGKDGFSLRKSVGKDSKVIPRAKIRTIKMTLSIICSFIFCWTPYFVVHLIHIWSEYNYNIPEPVYVFAETIALLNSALNPILYGCFNIKMKRGLFEVFCPNRLKNREKKKYKRNRTEFVSLADGNSCVDVAKKFSNRCVRESTSSSNTSNHSDKPDNSKARDSFIKEENVNGVKLRVRFVSESKNGGQEVDALLHSEDMDASMATHAL